MLPIELYSSKEKCQDVVGNCFEDLSVTINDTLTVKNNPHYLFLNKIVAPKGFYYLYMVYDKKNQVVKLGQSGKPYKRLNEHIACFITYGNSSWENISCMWSRCAFDINTNMERELLNEFKSTFPQATQIGSEFFVGVSYEDTIMFIKSFFIRNQRYQYK